MRVGRPAFDHHQIIGSGQRLHDDRQPVGGAHGADRIGGADRNDVAVGIEIGMDHITELRLRGEQIGDAGEKPAVQHRPRGGTRGGEVEQQDAQAGVGDLACHQNRRCGCFIAFGRDKYGARCPAGDQLFSRLLDVDLAEHRAWPLNLYDGLWLSDRFGLRDRLSLGGRLGLGNGLPLHHLGIRERFGPWRLGGTIDEFAGDSRLQADRWLLGISRLLVGSWRHRHFVDRRKTGARGRAHGTAREEFLQQRVYRGQQKRSRGGSANDRPDLGKVRLGGHRSRRGDPGVDRHVVAVLTRGCLAIIGQIEFELLALGGGIALQRVETDLLVAGLRRCCLQLIDVGDELAFARLGGIGLHHQALHDLLGFAADLRVEIGQL